MALTALALVLARPLSVIFVGYDPALLSMTQRAFAIYAISFLMTGVNIFGSSFFTALNDGLVSAVISFLRTMVFQVAAVFILPLLWELDGVWFSIVVAECLALGVTVFCFARFKGKYRY